MSDESFLSRWARRKREASRRRAPDVVKADQNEGDENARSATVQRSARGEEPAADRERLPPIESIGAASDLQAFLKPGVPLELTRAALRQAWTADPTIRDFVGLSENSWDFTAPDGVPGFGSLDADQVRRLLAQLTGETEVPTTASSGSDPARDKSAAEHRSADDRRDGQDHAGAEERGAQRDEHDDTATHQTTEEIAQCSVPRQRRHGGALPE